MTRRPTARQLRDRARRRADVALWTVFGLAVSVSAVAVALSAGAWAAM